MANAPQPGEHLSDAARFISVLAKHGVEFVVCEGAACILHGLARMTADIDLCVRLEAENLQRFVQAAGALGLVPRNPEPLEAIADPARRQDWIERKHAVVSTYTSPGSPLQLDVFLQYPIPYETLAADAVELSVLGCRFLVSSKQHLIRAKQLVRPMRKIDERDIDDLQELLDRERGSSERQPHA